MKATSFIFFVIKSNDLVIIVHKFEMKIPLDNFYLILTILLSKSCENDILFISGVNHK